MLKILSVLSGTQAPKWLPWRGATILALSLLAVHPVFAQKVTMEFDQAADFSRYKTFAIRDGELNSKNPALNSELVKKRIEFDIVKYLMARGLMEVSGPSDLNVRYHFGSARKSEIEVIQPDGMGEGRAMYVCRTAKARWSST